MARMCANNSFDAEKPNILFIELICQKYRQGNGFVISEHTFIYQKLALLEMHQYFITNTEGKEQKGKFNVFTSSHFFMGNFKLRYIIVFTLVKPRNTTRMEITKR